MIRFDAVSFHGGPLDGVCWPCVVNPDKVVFTTHPDAQGRTRAYLYECDQETDRGNGCTDYRMVLTPIDEEMIEEVAADMENCREDRTDGH